MRKLSKLKYLLKKDSIIKPSQLLVGGAEAAAIFGPLLLKVKTTKKFVVGPLAPTPDSLEIEKEEILQRADFLCSKLVTTPEKALHTYPKLLGDYYGPQWSIYAAVMTVAALSNIARLWPEEKAKALTRMEKLVEIVMSEEFQRYDALQWGEYPLDTLDGDKDHMTYLSLLAWVMSNYRLAGGSDRFDALYKEICHTLNRRMLKRKNYNMKSFPRTPLFSADMLVVLVALKNYGRIFGDDRYEESIENWLCRSRTVWIDNRTGLLVSTLRRNDAKGKVRGDYSGLNCFWLTLVDPDYAFEQYGLMKRYLGKYDGMFKGIRQYVDRSPAFAFDPDAGPIVDGLSPSGTAFAIGSATFFNDWDFRTMLLTTAARGGGDVRKNGMRHYKLGEFSLIGEAATLAMRTNKQELWD